MDISERAMLSTLTIQMWGGERIDNAASNELAASKHAERGSSKVVKRLVPDLYLKPIKQQAESIRHIWRTSTLPWTNDGQRINSTETFLPLMDKLVPAIDKFRDMGREFSERHYPTIVLGAASRLGDLFDMSDYPHPSVIAERFGAEISFSPVASDWRVKMGDAEIAYLTKQIEGKIADGIEIAMGTLVSSAVEQVQRLYDRLDALDNVADDQRAVLKGAVLEGIERIALEIPSMNITGDERLNHIARDIKAKLAKYDAAALRQNPALREEVKTSSRSILDTLSQYSVTP